MKQFLMIVVFGFLAMSRPSLAADVGVSVTVGQPGFYGKIIIGDYPYPSPRVIYREPRIIERVYIEREPIYLRVPPGHEKNWRKHCHKYDACGYPVYFVQDSWYEHDYIPVYREYHRDYHDDHRGDYRKDRRGDYHDGHRNERHDNGQKHNGNSQGKNKDKGKNH